VITYLTPLASHNLGRWRFSSYVTAVHALSVVAIARLLLSLGCDNTFCVQMITQACVDAPEKVNGYCDPSLSLLARYWDDTWEDLQDAAQTLLTAHIKRMSVEQKCDVVRLWRTRMQATELDKPKGVAVVIIGIMGCLDKDALDADLQEKIGVTLYQNIQPIEGKPSSNAALAADILARGFRTYYPHVGDVKDLIHTLFRYVAEKDDKRPVFAERIQSSLTIIAANAPDPFLQAMAQVGANTGVNMDHKVLTVKLVGWVIAKYSRQFESHTQTVVDYLMSLLNPGVPARREHCLRACTVVLRKLCQSYSFVSFHQDSQKYAVGTQSGTVVVYDLRTATKWRILQGQDGPITAAVFDPSGKKVASFCAKDSTVYVFQAGSYGMFEMFGLSGNRLSTGRCLALPRPLEASPVQLTWSPDGETATVTQDGQWVGCAPERK